jgi:hypothetical protein
MMWAREDHLVCTYIHSKGKIAVFTPIRIMNGNSIPAQISHKILVVEERQ